MSAARVTPVPLSRPGERGNVLVLAAILLPALLAFAGAAVDVRNGYVVRSMLQRAVDDGVLSAERWSTQVDDAPGSDAAGIERSAAAEALQVAQQELAVQGLGAVSSVAAEPAGTSLTMTAQARVPTFFLGLFGLEHWNVAARSGGTLWAAGTGPAASGGPPPSGPAFPGLPSLGEAGQGGGENGGTAEPGASTSADNSQEPQDLNGSGSTDANGPDSADSGSLGGGGGETESSW